MSPAKSILTIKQLTLAIKKTNKSLLDYTFKNLRENWEGRNRAVIIKRGRVTSFEYRGNPGNLPKVRELTRLYTGNNEAQKWNTHLVRDMANHRRGNAIKTRPL